MKRKFYPGQTENPYEGKVRIVSTVVNILVAETTNNVSAFDVVLPRQVPFKGAVLNLIAAHFMEATRDIIPNCLLCVPHPRVALWRKTQPFKFEVIVRGFNNVKSSFYRNYFAQKKMNPWGYLLSSEMKDNHPFPFLLITPTTKADMGHDEDISSEEIIRQGLATKLEWDYIEKTAEALFKRGQEMANKHGLILVDTKYEFGKDENGIIYLIDEIHTPDSSRYWYLSTYDDCLKNGTEPKALSKEFLRQWLIDQGFQGRDGDIMPEFSDELIESVSDRYIELYMAMGLDFTDLPIIDDQSDMYERVCLALERQLK